MAQAGAFLLLCGRGVLCFTPNEELLSEEYGLFDITLLLTCLPPRMCYALEGLHGFV